jgi:hypothetical protein
MGTRDLRPLLHLSLGGRRIGHWTPRYLSRRIRAILHARLHPEDPSLTPQATSVLASLLRPSDIGAEWGSGNSTRWFARRTAYLTSFESAGPYYDEVRASLLQAGLTNVDYGLIPFEHQDDEDAMHRSDWMRAAHSFADESLDFALVDSAPRGCLCAAVVPKLKRGGLLILDNANWYMPPPPEVGPAAPGTVSVPLGVPGSRVPNSRCWPAFASMTSGWRRHWSSDGIQMTLILFKA